MTVTAAFFYLFATVTVASGIHGDRVAQSRAIGAVPHPGLRQRGGAVLDAWAPSSWR